MTTVTHEKVKSTKIALYRTRLRVLHQENFSVLFFYKPPHRAAMLLAFCRSTPTEMSEKNFSFCSFRTAANFSQVIVSEGIFESPRV
ncbi:hypothetical protein EGJ48_23165 [Pantoea dispersa]|uniref:hypothetical protein n=1 Tax=Pantoea dispersa TaxID=59814 RepID=UPI000F683928|nr:hypothetical protein [Pantoea dispersa]RRW59456.1 hypothetical protein EGJ48_23165 [Pantoea dispersa]